MSTPFKDEAEAQQLLQQFQFHHPEDAVRTTTEPSHSTTLESYRQRIQAFNDARQWNQFHSPRNILLALNAEVGELNELFQWKPDSQCDIGLPAFTAEQKEKVGNELADVFTYLIRMAHVCHIDLPKAVDQKLAKNEAKYPTSEVQGSTQRYYELKEAERQRVASFNEGVEETVNSDKPEE